MTTPQHTTPDAATSWENQLVEAATADGMTSASALHYARELPRGYQAETSVQEAATDIGILEGLEPGGIHLQAPAAAVAGGKFSRLRLFACDTPVTLSQIVPVLHTLDLNVLDERPHAVARPDGLPCWIYDIGLTINPTADGHDPHSSEGLPERITDAFTAVWDGLSETDGFNSLVTQAGLDWRQVSIVRAYTAYLRQLGLPYSKSYILKVLLGDTATTADLIQLFAARFDPGADPMSPGHVDVLRTRIDDAINQVDGIDADRILRALLSLVDATTRTNHFRTDESGDRRSLVLKLDPTLIDEAPSPRPRFEVFVYSPRVEGVHLRFGLVARGGLRWSDRRDDYRTEILDLAKAQAVKNVVAVPAGAKGGFVVKRPPTAAGISPAAHRDAVHAEGVTCYREFVSGLLEVTDDLDLTTGAVVHPTSMVRHDGDDTYLVVAADKGTATFSDIANSLADERNFWLGDAFASGGSVGYDHKGMAITARGAWESAKRHFRELGVDTQSEEFTTVGVGDMSGDVFGNGMLMSRHIQLVAAFDHRHIFIDPTPDPATSFEERERLFALTRSSWADYDTSLLSEGGMIVSRNAKSVRINDHVRAALGFDHESGKLRPDDLIRAILRAPVDLLWNGGIGTYVKAAPESHMQVGDKANDNVRVDGAQLRAKVVAEGGNLGLTQRGRIEFARSGGRINTDALDNSAGVDCSDHEVNIKIAVRSLTADGTLTEHDRRELLTAMSDDVARLVIANNLAQNELMGMNRLEASRSVSLHSRLVDHLEVHQGLDRGLAGLPTQSAFTALGRSGSGLTSPELATLTAQVKLALKAEIVGSDVPDSAVFDRRLPEYFPELLTATFPDTVASHPLRRQIIATSLITDMVDNAGITYAFRLGEETGASGADAANVYECVTQIFDLAGIFTDIRATAASIPVDAVNGLKAQTQRLIDRASRWLIAARPQPTSPNAEIGRYGDRIQHHAPEVRQWLRGDEIEALDRRIGALVDAGAPRQVATRVAELLHVYCFFDIADVADIAGREFAEVADLYFAISARLHINWHLTAVTQLGQGDRWHALARLALREDLYSSLRAITLDALTDTAPGQSAAHKIEQWERLNYARLERAELLLSEVAAETTTDLALAPLSVAARRIRSVIRTPQPQL